MAGDCSSLQLVSNGDIITEPTKVMEAIEQYYSHKMAAGPSITTGKYLPADIQRNYPWEAKQVDDKLTHYPAGE